MKDLKVKHYDDDLCPTAKIGPKIYHVSGAISGESVNTKEYAVDGRNVYSNVQSVVEPSVHRVEPACKICHLCGGCTLLHVDYPHQLEIKKAHIKRVLSSVVDEELVEDCVGLSQF